MFNIYISPSTDPRPLLDTITNIINAVKSSNPIIIIAGDLNARHPTWSYYPPHSQTQITRINYLSKFICNNDFVSCFEPTPDNWTWHRKIGDEVQFSAIDTILINPGRPNIISSSITDHPFTDHRLLSITFNTHLIKTKKEITVSDKDAINLHLAELASGFNTNDFTNLTDAWLKLTNLIKEIINANSTIKTVPTYSKIKSQIPKLMIQYRGLKNMKPKPSYVKEIIRQLRVKINELKRNSSVLRSQIPLNTEQLYSWIRKLRDSDIKTIDDLTCDSANNLFLQNIDSFLSDFIPVDQPLQPLTFTLTNFHDETPPKLSPDDIDNLIKGLKSAAAPGADKMTKNQLLILHRTNPNLLTTLINQVINQNIFPKPLKIGRLTLIPKADGVRARPIQSQLNLSKLIEKQLTYEILSRLPANWMDSQFGFLPNKSLTDAIATFVDIVLENLDRKCTRKLMLVQVDMSCAFDTLDRHSIIHNLISLKLPNWLTNTIASYLSERVTYYPTRQLHKAEDKGVPQGSVLGPLLFCITLQSAIRRVWSNVNRKVISYADDVNFFVSCSFQYDHNFLQRRAESDLNLLIIECKKLGLTLNPKKTKFIHIQNIRKYTPLHLLGATIRTYKFACDIDYEALLSIMLDKLRAFRGQHQQLSCLSPSLLKQTVITYFTSVLNPYSPFIMIRLLSNNDNISTFNTRIAALIKMTTNINYIINTEDLLQLYDLRYHWLGLLRTSLKWLNKCHQQLPHFTRRVISLFEKLDISLNLPLNNDTITSILNEFQDRWYNTGSLKPNSPKIFHTNHWLLHNQKLLKYKISYCPLFLLTLDLERKLCGCITVNPGSNHWFHFIVECPKFANLRQQLISALKTNEKRFMNEPKILFQQSQFSTVKTIIFNIRKTALELPTVSPTPNDPDL